MIFFFKDVNECSSTSTNNCDVTGRATCTNTPGSFTCACKPGFQGAGTAGTCKGNLVIYLNYSGLVLLCKNLPLFSFVNKNQTHILTHILCFFKCDTKD